jgi:hypothetical protein
MCAVLLAEERSAKLAERMALEALQTDDKCATALAALGLAQFRQRRYAESQQTLQRGLASHPNHDLLRTYMAHVLRVTHQHSKAQALTSLMTDDPKTASLAEELQKDDRLRDAARRLYERKEFQDEIFEYRRNHGWRPVARVAGWTLLILLFVMVPFVILPPRDPTQFGVRVLILALVVGGAWAKQRL